MEGGGGERTRSSLVCPRPSFLPGHSGCKSPESPGRDSGPLHGQGRSPPPGDLGVSPGSTAWIVGGPEQKPCGGSKRAEGAEEPPIGDTHCVYLAGSKVG